MAKTSCAAGIFLDAFFGVEADGLVMLPSEARSRRIMSSNSGALNESAIPGYRACLSGCSGVEALLSLLSLVSWSCSRWRKE